MTRRTVKFDDEVHARLKEHKRKGESWDALGNRLADLAESDMVSDDPLGPRCTECGRLVQQWTTDGGEVVCLDCADIDADATLPD
jgi:hypothetical protein